MLEHPPHQSPPNELRLSLEERGFVLPVAVGLGLIMILVGVTMITRSHQSRVTATAQKATAKSLAAAETGITHYQALINNNRMLATYCANPPITPPPSPPTPDPEASCRTGMTWATLCDGVTPVSSLVDQIRNAARNSNSDWHSEDSDPWQTINGDSKKGEYRLVEYIYEPADPTKPHSSPGRGKLTVEGRANQEAGTSFTKLSVDIPVMDSPSQPPGLWLQDVSSPPSDLIQLETGIQDSSCSGSAITQLEPSQQASFISQNAATPELALPALPSWGSGPPPTGPGSYSISTVSGSRTFPNPLMGEIADNATVVYQIQVDPISGQSIDLTTAETLTIGTSNETIILYLDGGLNLDSGASINITAGSKLIIYLQDDITAAAGASINIPSTSELIIFSEGNITLSSDGSNNPIVNNGTPDNVEFYVYDTKNVLVDGGSSTNPIKLFLFAPDSVVSMSDGANVEGTIWAKDWQGTGPVKFTAFNTDLSKTQVGPLPPSNRIQSITNWQRQQR